MNSFPGCSGLDRVDHGTEAKAVTHGLRYNADLNNRIEAATKPGGFSSPNTFLRAAIKRELAGLESGVDVAEQSIAASLDRIARGNLQFAVRPPGVVRFRRCAGEDVLDLCQKRRGMCTLNLSPAPKRAMTGLSRTKEHSTIFTRFGASGMRAWSR